MAVSLNLLIPYIIRIIIDGLSDGTCTHAILFKQLGLFLLLSILAIIFSWLLRRIPLRICHHIEYSLRQDLFTHLTKLDQAFFRNERTGNLMTRLSSDVTIIRDSIGQGLLQGIRTVTVLILATLVMFFTEPLLASIVMMLYLPMVIIFFLILRVMRRRQKELQEHVSEVSNFSQESFSGIRCIKGFALENRRIKQFIQLNKDLIQKQMHTAVARQSLWPFMAFCFNLGMILILNVGGRRIMSGDLSLGTLTQFVQYLLYMQWPLLALSWTMSLLQRGRVSWQRIQDILQAEPSICEMADPHPLSAPAGALRFNHVSYTIEGRHLLHDINLSIPAGTTLGITGPTGCGKTLLVSLVARLMDPTSGTLELDGIDLRQLALHELRRQIGFTAQEPILFSRTLSHNIGFGVLTPDATLIGWAADIAHLRHDIESFRDGYETLLGERGVTLSGGQRQRTAISRAIARRPNILILDDVLSAVDTQTEAAIMTKLQPVMKQRTTLFVSHRISTLRYADSLIVIENGRITQRGTHTELLQQPGYYAELNTMQQLQQQLEGDA